MIKFKDLPGLSNSVVFLETRSAKGAETLVDSGRGAYLVGGQTRRGTLLTWRPDVADMESYHIQLRRNGVPWVESFCTTRACWLVELQQWADWITGVTDTQPEWTTQNQENCKPCQ